MTKYRLKDEVNFKFVNKKSIINFDFDLTPYYDKETRLFEFPQGYVDFSCMGVVFVDFLIPLDLVEELEEGEKDV